MICIDMLVEIG